MAKRGYKLQEFVAHSGNVNCLSFGKKNCRVFITGGDDQKVNLWSVGKPTSLMSLCGHTSPVESATFDSAEVLVAAGSSSGAIKLWDLEETKMVRTLTGHRSYCTALEFHPFGEFFASGSMDTNLKIWDIRKKGCIHTYKGHTRGISTIRFTPDGRWVVSGGFDNVVKIWDLTAGKLLHEFKFHEGHIRSIEFHPLEFLLATGSADKTVKFWDLETFEMIGSARREATGVRSIAFHPDGRTLFCGLDDSLKVYSWEPVICHDSVDMGWSTLGDLCISDGKLLGGAYYENSVAVWVADVSLIEPYGSRLAPEQNSHVEQKCDSQGSPLEKEEKIVNSKSNLRSTTPDSDSKEIKTIYVDCVNSITSKTVDPLDTPKVPLPSDSREISTIGTQKRGSAVSIPAKSSVRAGNRSLVMPSIIPRDGPDGKDSVGSRRQSLAPAKVSSSLSAKPHHTRRFSSGRFDMEKMSVSLDAMPYDSLKITLGRKEDSNLRNRLVVDENAKESSEGKQSSTKTVAERVDRTPSAETVSSTGDPALSSSEGVKPVKVVNGVAVVHGRTRSLVERFERREKIDVDEINRPNSPSGVTSEPVETPLSQSDDQQMVKRFEGNDQQTIKRSGSSGQLMVQRLEGNDQQTIKNLGSNDQLMIKRLESNDQQTIKRSGSSGQLMVQRLEGNDQQNVKSLGSNDQIMVERLESTDQLAVKRSGSNDQLMVKRLESTDQQTIKRSGSNNHLMVKRLESTDQQTVKRSGSNDHLMVKRLESIDQRIVKRSGSNGQLMVKRLDSNEQQTIRRLGSNDQRTIKRLDINDQRMTKRLENHDQKMIKRLESNDQQTVMTEQPTSGEVSIIEDLMQNHDMLLSTFRSRLTKLQVVRHFWERNDIKGAIGAVKKLPDHSVQADVIGALIEKMEIITLDLFSCLLPVLLGLLESKVERHATVSLEMLLKLVAVFGTTVRSTISARRAVGVDLHAEERLECCKQCFAHLQSVQNILPELVRRGGAVARYSQQLNLVLQQL